MCWHGEYGGVDPGTVGAGECGGGCGCACECDTV